MKAKAIVGDVIIGLPVEYLEQQTCSNSVFENVPTDMVDVNALIEANRTIGASWYYHEKIGEDRRVLHIIIPTDKLEWGGLNDEQGTEGFGRAAGSGRGRAGGAGLCRHGADA